jgi:hypothetical protein
MNVTHLPSNIQHLGSHFQIVFMYACNSQGLIMSYIKFKKLQNFSNVIT